MVPTELRDFKKRFFRAVDIKEPLQPDSDYYVKIYTKPEDDPVRKMLQAIEFSPGESAQLLSGYRGSGKSTELQRLKRDLVLLGYQVIIVDIEDYLNLGKQIDISDFLLSLAGAVSDGLVKGNIVPKDPAREGYFRRFAHWLTTTEVSLTELGLKADAGVEPAKIGADVKLGLKEDPSFRARLQAHMKGHLGALIADIRSFLGEMVQEVRLAHGTDAELVVLVDSIEHIRGNGSDAEAVQQSLEEMLTVHTDKLRLPDIHVVYTVPPWMRVRYGGLGALFGAGVLQTLPAVTIAAKPVPHGSPSAESEHKAQAGRDALVSAIERRGDWRILLGDRKDLLDRIVLHSGGHLRDLFRIVAEILLRSGDLPVPEGLVNSAINQLRSEFFPITQDDARWLTQVAASNQAEILDHKSLPDFARLLDTHLVLCYRNGEDWYDVHPLVKARVLAQAHGGGGPADPAPAPAG